MGIKEHDIAAATSIKPFGADICNSSPLNDWTSNDLASSTVNTVNSSHIDNPANNQRQRQRRPDRAVYVPRGRRSQTTPPAAVQATSPTAIQVSKNTNLISTPTISAPVPVPTSIPSQNGNITNWSPPHEPGIDSPPKDENKIVKNPKQLITDRKPLSNQDESTQNSAANMAKVNGKSETYVSASDKDYNEEKEFQRASKEINRRNRRIIKQTFDSDVLEINDTLSAQKASTSPPNNSLHLAKKSNLPQSEVQCNNSSSKFAAKAKSKSKSKDAAISPETDDWESMFDENGECLDPKLVDEITTTVGKVTITKPKSDYKAYQDPVNLEDEEFPHVLEVSNFPVEFKTQDLMQIFAEYKDTGYDIKWVDDTHALVVFSSSKIAARVLTEGHAFVKLKPLTQATAESKSRAKKSSLFLQPYRQRPETCAALARRLVTGALGVRLSTAREEREIERRVLKEAKERKLLAAKLRDEAWEN